MANRLPYKRRPGSWVEDALCKEIGTEAFFPPDDKPVARDFYRKAKLICEGCKVSIQCLEYGLDEPYGVWGGMSPIEREMIRNRGHRPN